MHKRIIKAISLALTQREQDQLIEITYFRDPLMHQRHVKTNGFFIMKITTKVGYTHLLSHIERIGLSIGTYYGEYLEYKKGRRSIEFR